MVGNAHRNRIRSHAAGSTPHHRRDRARVVGFCDHGPPMADASSSDAAENRNSWSFSDYMPSADYYWVSSTCPMSRAFKSMFERPLPLSSALQQRYPSPVSSGVFPVYVAFNGPAVLPIQPLPRTPNSLPDSDWNLEYPPTASPCSATAVR